jgi:biotin transport system substrate-specific component
VSSTALAPSLATTLRAPAALRDVALVVAGTTLIALSAQVSVPLPWTPVPLTGQTFGFLLIGGAMGLARGFAASSLYLVVGLAGLPVFANHSAGAHVFGSPTGGYLVAMLLAAALVGYAADRGWDRSYLRSLLMMIAGSALIYIIGAGWLGHSLDVDAATAIHLGVTPFLVGDALKLGLVGLVLPASWRGLSALGVRTTRTKTTN